MSDKFDAQRFGDWIGADDVTADGDPQPPEEHPRIVTTPDPVCFSEGRILIVDVETSGTDPVKDHVVEIACILWDIGHSTAVHTIAGLVYAQSNAASDVNGIPESLLRTLPANADVWSAVSRLADRADAFLAHNAAFDRSFCDVTLDPDDERRLPWICSMGDVEWPIKSNSRGLVAMALAHGVGVLDAHRALTDCQTLARMLENCRARGIDVRAMLGNAMRHALLPKYRYVSVEPFERKDDVRAAGFHWDDKRREWWRVMAEEDAAKVAGIRMRRGELQK